MLNEGTGYGGDGGNPIHEVHGLKKWGSKSFYSFLQTAFDWFQTSKEVGIPYSDLCAIENEIFREF